MPTYQYSCTDCGHFFETVQSFSDDSLTVCPECEGRLRKVFNAVGVVFKGSGFYRNDSRAQNGAKESAPSGSSRGLEQRLGHQDRRRTSEARRPPRARRRPRSSSGSSSSTPSARRLTLH